MFDPFVLGLLAGYLIWTFLSHPKSPVRKLCPKINFGKRVQILPQWKIFYKKEHKALIFHHWLSAVLILIFFLIFSNGLVFLKGFLVGSIGQGLKYQDRFQLREVMES